MANIRLGLVRLGRVAIGVYVVAALGFLGIIIHDGMVTIFRPHTIDWSFFWPSLANAAPTAGLLAAMLAGLYALGRGLLWALDGFLGRS
jgi:hypothetical protein